MTDSSAIFDATSPEDTFSFSNKTATRNELLEEARKTIPDIQVLINMVSKRVRQLSSGHRPMVDITPRMSLSMIALKEIADGKLEYRTGSSELW